ncbi:amidase family protein [Variovorax guangxiensis]|uniref:amidase family protein n=1 Tax=Variovorax guangxiensis TaxID=1775474 RepID=UPI00286A2C00|nr:amidase family protein [Variovorax guangxiensis]
MPFAIAGQIVDRLLLAKNVFPSSCAGLPGISLPIGLSSSGLPIGMEMDGPPGSDQTILDIAARVFSITMRSLLSSNACGPCGTPPASRTSTLPRMHCKVIDVETAYVGTCLPAGTSGHMISMSLAFRCTSLRRLQVECAEVHDLTARCVVQCDASSLARWSFAVQTSLLLAGTV